MSKNLKLKNDEVNPVVLFMYNVFLDFLFRLTKKCYSYPVVYTDGFISRLIEDKKERVPFGIVVNNEIIILEEPEGKMNALQAEEYVEKRFFAGKDATLPSFNTLSIIKKNVHKINALMRQLGGKEFRGGWYRSSSKLDRGYSLKKPSPNLLVGKNILMQHMNTNHGVLMPFCEDDDLTFIRASFVL